MTEPQAISNATQTSAPSTGTLLFLFGEQVAAPAGRLGGTVVPYAGVKVKSEDLATTVLAATLWGLRQAGLLELREATKKAMGMFKQQHVEATIVGAPTLRTGYDDVVLRGVGEGTTVYDLIYRWLGKDTADPAGRVLAVANDEMVALGLAAAVDAGRGGLTGKLLGNTRIEPDRDRIATLWATFEQAAAGWASFRQAEPTLASALVESCNRAVRNRVDRD